MCTGMLISPRRDGTRAPTHVPSRVIRRKPPPNVGSGNTRRRNNITIRCTLVVLEIRPSYRRLNGDNSERPRVRYASEKGTLRSAQMPNAARNSFSWTAWDAERRLILGC